MRSMTGFGRGCTQAKKAGVNIQVEISSVNRKSLDTQISAPREWSGFDIICNEWVKGNFQRGRVNIQVLVELLDGSKNSLIFDSQAMEESLNNLFKFAKEQGLDLKPDAGFLIDLARTTKSSKELPDWKEIKKPLKEAFEIALNEIEVMRSKEGAIIAKDLKKRIRELDTFREKISKNSSGSSKKYREMLLERLKLLNLDLNLSDERVLKELALFADRSDVSEEITRLSSHFEQFFSFIIAKEATGRKMDFLCQEIHRELNTIGSKSNDIEITRVVIESKNALERIREQVQNIE